MANEADLTTIQNAKGWTDLADKAISGITKANPAVVTCSNHNFKTGRQVVLSGVAGMTRVNGLTFVVTVVDANHFSIGVDSSGYGTYVSGGLVGVDDVTLARLITAVSGWITREVGRPLLSQSFTDTYNGKGSNRQSLRNTPVSEVDSVTVDGVSIPAAASSTASGFLFDDQMIYLNGYRFSRGFQNVQVAYTGGLLDGDPLLSLAEQACIRLVALAYNERTRTGQSSKTLSGESVNFDLKELPSDVARMIQALKKVVPV